MDIASFAAALLLGLVHILAGRLRMPAGPYHGAWLSFAGGAAAAYALLHLLPEVEAAQSPLAELAQGAFEHPASALALAGFVLYRGLDRMAAISASAGRQAGRGEVSSQPVFALHMAFFAFYNGLLGYLMAQGPPGGLLPYAGALALHFTVNDASLREHHSVQYDRFGRWLLAAAVLAGWGLGTAGALPAPLVHAGIAVVAGGVLLHIFKDELPANRQARYGAFLLGIAFYGVLRLMAQVLP